MTTLPQTTQVHLPRPVSPTALAPAHAAHATPGLVAGGTPGLSGADVWRVIRGNMLLISILIALFTVLGVVAHLVLLKMAPRYTAVGLVQVEDRVMATSPRQAREAVFLDQNRMMAELRTQAQIMQSESLVAQVLKSDRTRIRDTTWYKSLVTPESGNIDKAKKELLDDFSVSPIPESKLLRVQMKCATPRDAKLIVEDMVNTHIEGQRRSATARMGEQTKLLNELKLRYQNQWKTDSMRLAEATRRTGDMGAGRVSVLQLELQNLVATASKAGEIAGQARGAYDSVQQAVAAGVDPPMVEEAVNRDVHILQMKADLDYLKVNRATMLLEKGESHRDVVQLDKRIQEMQRAIDEAIAEVKARLRGSLAEELRSQVLSTERMAKEAEKGVNGAKEEIAKLNKELADLLAAEENEKASRALFREVSDQLSDTEAVATQVDQARVEWVAPPEEPDRPSFPKLWIVLPLAILLGIGVALGVAFLREVLDETVRSPRDIAKVGQMALLGMISDESVDPQAAEVRLPLVIFEAPHSILAENFRQFRTRLQHAASLDTTRSIMVTGASPMDGKTTVACNLAAGLALNGRKILLVDANFRRPEIHRIFQVANEQGFSDVLNGAVGFDEMVQETQIPNLSIMASGPKPLNPTELFESQLLIDFIERALEEFDHVIFDSGPLLVVSESSAMAPRVDGVITVVRAHNDSRGLLSRVRDQLRQIKAEHLGVVLNGVRPQAGGYYKSTIRTYYEYQDSNA